MCISHGAGNRDSTGVNKLSESRDVGVEALDDHGGVDLLESYDGGATPP